MGVPDMGGLEPINPLALMGKTVSEATRHIRGGEEYMQQKAAPS